MVIENHEQIKILKQITFFCSGLGRADDRGKDGCKNKSVKTTSNAFFKVLVYVFNIQFLK